MTAKVERGLQGFLDDLCKKHSGEKNDSPGLGLNQGTIFRNDEEEARSEGGRGERKRLYHEYLT